MENMFCFWLIRSNFSKLDHVSNGTIPMVFTALFLLPLNKLKSSFCSSPDEQQSAGMLPEKF